MCERILPAEEAIRCVAVGSASGIQHPFARRRSSQDAYEVYGSVYGTIDSRGTRGSMSRAAAARQRRNGGTNVIYKERLPMLLFHPWVILDTTHPAPFRTISHQYAVLLALRETAPIDVCILLLPAAPIHGDRESDHHLVLIRPRRHRRRRRRRSHFAAPPCIILFDRRRHRRWGTRLQPSTATPRPRPCLPPRPPSSTPSASSS